MPSPEERRSGPGENRAAKTVATTVQTKVAPPSDRSRKPRRIRVVIEGRHAAFVSGWGSRELLTELRGRSPVYSSLTRAWSTTEATARSLVALAEHRGYEVDVESYVALAVKR